MEARYTLLPVSLEDGPQVARTQHLGFADDAFNAASFPNIAVDVKIQDSIERWAANFSSPGAVYMKVVDEEQDGAIVCYSKWQMDNELARAIKAELSGKVMNLDGGTKLERKDPVGLNEDLAEEMTAKVVDRRKTVLGDRPHIRK